MARSRPLLGSMMLVLASASLPVACRQEPTCADRAAAMRTALEPALRQARIRDRIAPSVTLQRGTGQEVEPAMVVTVTRHGISLDGEPLVDAPLPDEEGTRTLAERLRARAPASVGLAIDAGARWELVVEAVRMVEPGGARLVLLLDGPPDPALVASPLAQQLDAAGEGSLALMTTAIRTHVGACREAEEVFASMASTSDVLTRLPEAVEACGCQADIEPLTEVTRVIFEGTPIVGVALEPGASGSVVRSSASTPWATVAARVLDAAPRVRFELDVEPEPEPAPEPAPEEPEPPPPPPRPR